VAYGAAESVEDRSAKRIAYLIDPKGKIAEAHPSVSASSFPREQLDRLKNKR
jgi:peroxiredoxin